MLSCRNITEQSQRVLADNPHVSLDTDAVESLAADMASGDLTLPSEDPDLLFQGTPDACANFVLLMDTLNFCFWSDTPWSVEYRGRTWTRTLAMVASIKRAVEADAAWLEARRWAETTPRDIADLFRGDGMIPMPDERVRVLREAGRVLNQHYDGRFLTLVDMAGRDAESIAVLLAEQFTSFHDVARFRDLSVPLLKRAQICVADLHRVLLANNHEGLARLEALTVFADYRLPQLFRHRGMLRLTDELARQIDRRQLIPAGSAEEVSIRAATIVLATMLRESLERRGCSLATWQLDHLLWLRSRRADVTVEHHRTLTCFY